MQDLLSNPKNELFFSAASLWEIAIKHSLGRDDFQVNARLLRRGLLDNGYIELPIGSEHAVSIDSLPMIHKDPFDRMLVEQAMVEGDCRYSGGTVSSGNNSRVIRAYALSYSQKTIFLKKDHQNDLK